MIVPRISYFSWMNKKDSWDAHSIFHFKFTTTVHNWNTPPSRRLSTLTFSLEWLTKMGSLQIVRTLCAQNKLQDALSIFYALWNNNSSPPLPPTSVSQTYATLLQTCAQHRHLPYGKSLHHHMHSLNHHPDLFVTNHLINMYAKCGRLDSARQLFDEMPLKNLVSWTALISGYDQHGFSKECFILFSRMLVDHHPSEFAFSSVLGSCNCLQGPQVHALALKTSFDTYVYVGNALITMYFKSYEFCDDTKDCLAIFESMPTRNVITWNSMIAGFYLHGLWDKSLEFFSQMHREGVEFDRSTIISTISSLCCIEKKGKEVRFGIEHCHELHCMVIKVGFSCEVEVATSLVKAYSKLGGDSIECYKIFVETTGSRDVVSWTGIITTFAEQEPEQALLLFCQFLHEGLNPDCYTFSIVIKACAGLPTERHSLSIHGKVIKYGFEDDMVLSNALVHAYARCGSIDLSMQVFGSMAIRDLVSWNSMFKAYAVHGQGNKALDLFQKMDIQPDATTFVALLSACSHAGLVAEGIKIFNSIYVNYGISPQCDHFACMVDILGRAGRLREAEALIRRMPMEPDYVVWTALLVACRKHGETEIAEMASRKLMELEPKNSLGYVLMANIYCSQGSFVDAALIRKEMRGSRVRKEPGLSWIEIGSRMHEFAAGGQRHPQREAIYAKLKELVWKLKEIGYVPETSLALHDIVEEHIEEQLYYHSEKLALAFALISTSCRGSVLKIMKNIRICVDCHNFMKLASNLIDKEIIMRDANRFHHFKSGSCSCSDYW